MRIEQGEEHPATINATSLAADIGEVAPEDFETPSLDDVGDDDGDDVSQGDEITKLVSYLTSVSHSSYVRKDFDERLDAAKLTLQTMNYRKMKRLGFLREEMDRLKVQFDRLPRAFGWLTFFCSSAIVAWLVSTKTGVTTLAANQTPWWAISLMGLITIVFIVMAVAFSAVRWWQRYGYKNAGITRAKRIRLHNHDVLVNKIKNIQLVAAEKARNKDPEKGSTGLLRIYLTFICGYVLHKTLNRCFTRFKEDLHEIEVDRVSARLSMWLFGAFVALVCAAVALFIAQDPAKPLTFIETGSVALFVASPILFGWVTQSFLHNYSMRRSGRVSKQLAFLAGLYSTRISNDILKQFNEQATQRSRFDFPDIYKYNDVEDYSTWLYQTLSALKRHEDETRK